MQAQITTPTFGDDRLPARFWAKVNPNGPIPTHRPDLGPCWVWVGIRNSGGYGHFYVGSRRVGAHRLAYETLVGPIPDGLEPDHLCRNHPCICPAHLETVSHTVNIRRGVHLGTHSACKGEANARARLTKEHVLEIRRLRGSVSLRVLATRYGVNQAAISKVQLHRTWRHV